MQNAGKRRRQKAFTLIELIVAIGLMIILVGAVAMIFYRCVEVFKVAEARTIIYTNARAACDKIAQDLAGTLPITPNALTTAQLQHFRMGSGPPPSDALVGRDSSWMPNYAPATDSLPLTLGSDWMVFNTVTSFDGVVQVVRVSYFLTLDPDPAKRTAARTTRPIYVLWRMVRKTTTGGGLTARTSPIEVPALMTTGSPPVPVPGLPSDMCHYVAQFRLDWSPPAGASPAAPQSGYHAVETQSFESDAQSQATRYLPTSIRIRMRLIEDSQERQERLITRVIWLPMGGS
ncbi:MAG: type II secretion system protein [Planctomycetes bacterium]|nr:type II secretion system protein [Planctomycetota bacterium]